MSTIEFANAKDLPQLLKTTTTLIGNLGRDVEVCTAAPRTWEHQEAISDLPDDDAAARFLIAKLGSDPFQEPSQSADRHVSGASTEKAYLKFSVAISTNRGTRWVQCRAWHGDDIRWRNIRLHGTRGTTVKIEGRYRVDRFTDRVTGQPVSFGYFEVVRVTTVRRRNFKLPAAQE